MARRPRLREAPLGLYAYQPDPATAQLPAGAHLAGAGTHGELHARRAGPAAGARSRCIPTTPTPRGIEDGDDVRVFNDLGALRMPASRSRGWCGRHRVVPQGRVAAAHRQPFDLERPGARHADRPGGRARASTTRASQVARTAALSAAGLTATRLLSTSTTAACRAAAAHHAALAAGVPRFARRPFVCGALGVGGAATLAGNLPLLLGGHRRETSAGFRLFVHGAPRLAAKLPVQCHVPRLSADRPDPYVDENRSSSRHSHLRRRQHRDWY